MATFAPPVRRGDFLFSSVLYADPGNGNHHPRASVAELAALLRPEAPNLYSKGRKPDVTAPVKDPAWHYYSAQLIHFGLPVTKDKNAAKVRLLNALNQFKLEVPAWVLKLEGELKKEWEAENRNLKKGAGAGVKGAKSAKSKAGQGEGGLKGSQTANSGVNVTVNLMLPSDLSMGEQQDKSKPKKPAAAKRKRADNDVASPSSTPQKAARIKSEATPRKKQVKKETMSAQTASRVKQEHREPPPASAPSRSRVKQEQNSTRTQRSPYEPSPYIKNDPHANVGSRNQDTIFLSGLYQIDCPIASDIFQEYDFDLTLSLDSMRSTWWATFRWGGWDGIIQMNPGPSFDTLSQPCSLGWRLRDLDSGKLTFGRKCTGWMTFFEDQTFRGTLSEIPGAGEVEFEGRRVPGPNVEDDLRDEWDGFVKEAYQR